MIITYLYVYVRWKAISMSDSMKGFKLCLGIFVYLFVNVHFIYFICCFYCVMLMNYLYVYVIWKATSMSDSMTGFKLCLGLFVYLFVNVHLFHFLAGNTKCDKECCHEIKFHGWFNEYEKLWCDWH